jgi:cold shock CspA family protein/ribosome-associated translation inhibitor RaiA
MEARIRELAESLDTYSTHIMHCHVVVSEPDKHHHQGNQFDVRIDLTAPGTEIVINTESRDNPAHEDPYVALRDAFKAVRRKLQDYEREHRLDVKTHAIPPSGWICELSPAEDFGRIRTADEREIYFHRNSLVGGQFDKLVTGTEVRFTEEQGAQGPQASTVHIVHAP